MPSMVTADSVFPDSTSSQSNSNREALESAAVVGVSNSSSSVGRNDNTDDQVDQDKLVLWQGIALLTADCMGVGILGLPNEIKVLGWAAGLTFLVVNCPINFYAGNLLSVLALKLEADDGTERNGTDVCTDAMEVELAATANSAATGDSNVRTIRKRFSNKKQSYQGLPQQHRQLDTGVAVVQESIFDEEEDVVIIENHDEPKHDGEDAEFSEGSFQDEMTPHDGEVDSETAAAGAIWIHTSNRDNDKQTSDLINITAALFSPDNTLAARTYTALVKILYYVNLFLVLGDYILVMSRSVAAFIGEDILCLPTAGAIASILMFGLCQFRTMANLGRSVSLASLLALLIVIIQCLFHHRRKSSTENYATDVPETRSLLQDDEGNEDDDGIWGKFSSLAGIGFAVGSQKLFLNIRHELKHRDEASRVLAGSLFTYGSAYVVVVLLAGPDPPSFLFDSIPDGWGRKMAGLLLWFHVAVSYAINSQALCASLDHSLTAGSSVRGTSMLPWLGNRRPAVRWFGITLVVSLSSYTVSNAIPFFKDLVALIGALTSVPLSLTLPAILHRKSKNIALLLPDRSCLSTGSYFLLIYSFIFLSIGLIGALSEIEEDWLIQGKPFACH